MITVHREVIGVAEFQGTSEEGEISKLAVQSYGHILKAQGQFNQVRKFTFGEFADLIEAQTDCANPRNACVVSTLRKIQARNPSCAH